MKLTRQEIFQCTDRLNNLALKFGGEHDRTFEAVVLIALRVMGNVESKE